MDPANKLADTMDAHAYEEPAARRIKKWLKGFPLIVRLKRKAWSYFDGSHGTTKLNVAQAFPLYLPYSAGNYEMRSRLTLEAINQVFPLLGSLAQRLRNREAPARNIEELSADAQNRASAGELKRLFDKYGSDKANEHNYHHVYGAILRDPESVENIFEIGLGTNNTDVASNMGARGKPGASLRAFRDYCPNAAVFGADVDRRVLFEEERIKTFFVDQTKPATFDPLLQTLPEAFDLVIDDGLHSPNANIASLEFGLKIVRKGGWVVVEDIVPDAISVWQVVSSLLPDSYEPHIFSAQGGVVFAVKRLQ
jgi:SAM-dependent methyltransferase